MFLLNLLKTAPGSARKIYLDISTFSLAWQCLFDLGPHVDEESRWDPVTFQ